jgi:Fe-S cluster biogenesis protein NfuA
MNERNFKPENFDKKEEAFSKRMPITLEVGGKKQNVWVSYNIELKEYSGNCTGCGKEAKSKIESIKNIKVESDDPEAVRQAEEKLRTIIDAVEREMFVCGDCFDDDFIKNRADLYIEKLEMMQDKLGIEVDKEQQRKMIKRD